MIVAFILPKQPFSLQNFIQIIIELGKPGLMGNFLLAFG